MQQLEAFTARRRALARRYFERFDTGSGCVLPLEDYSNCNWHMFQVLLPLARMRISRGEFIQAMHQRGIGSGVHYPAMHLFKLYRELGYAAGDFPQAERIGSSTLTLPLFPAMADADVDRVCTAVAEIIRDSTK
jgi:dTDP-4-amino-4,6-dideoxygalactose transaminase